MINIVVREGSSDKMVEEFAKVIEIVPIERINKVKIFYEKIKGLPDYECFFENYPVTLYTDMNITIYLFTLTAGYNGSGPNHLVEVLKLAGFNINENLITGNNKLVDLILEK